MLGPLLTRGERPLAHDFIVRVNEQKQSEKLRNRHRVNNHKHTSLSALSRRDVHSITISCNSYWSLPHGHADRNSAALHIKASIIEFPKTRHRSRLASSIIGWASRSPTARQRLRILQPDTGWAVSTEGQTRAYAPNEPNVCSHTTMEFCLASQGGQSSQSLTLTIKLT